MQTHVIHLEDGVEILIEPIDEPERRWRIVRNGELEATNYFFSIGDQENVLERTYNHDGRSYDMGTAYGHIAIGVDDLDGTLGELAEQGIQPEREPYRVREGGSRLCFVRDPDRKPTIVN